MSKRNREWWADHVWHRYPDRQVFKCIKCGDHTFVPDLGGGCIPEEGQVDPYGYKKQKLKSDDS